MKNKWIEKRQIEKPLTELLKNGKKIFVNRKKTIHLYDCENVGIPNFSTLNKTEHHFLFLGSKQNAIDPHFINHESDLKQHIRIYKLDMTAHNALDCYLSYELGNLCAKYPRATFIVHSMDRDYDAVIDYLQRAGKKVFKNSKIVCQPRRKIASFNQERIDQLMALEPSEQEKIKKILVKLNTLPTDQLPASKMTLFNYILNNGLSEKTTKSIVDAMTVKSELKF